MSPVEFLLGHRLTRVIFEIVEQGADGYTFERREDPALAWQEARDKLRGIWHLYHEMNDTRFNLSISKQIEWCDNAITDLEYRAMLTASIRAAKDAVYA